MHHFDPVAQRVDDHLQDARMRYAQRIAATGEIHRVAAAFRAQPVIGRVVDAAKAQRRAHLVAFRRVVVDDVEYHLDAGGVKRRDRVFEFGVIAAAEITRLRRKKADRVVAPVIAQIALDEMAVIDPGMDGKEFDGRHAEPPQMIDHRRLAQRPERAAQMLGDIRVGAREAPDMHLIDHGVAQRRA